MYEKVMNKIKLITESINHGFIHCNKTIAVSIRATECAKNTPYSEIKLMPDIFYLSSICTFFTQVQNTNWI